MESLSEPNLHQILYFLPAKDATKTSVLSKTWYSAWHSFPVLDFNQIHHNIGPRKKPKVPAHDFLNYVGNSVPRRCQNMTIQRFNLTVESDIHTIQETPRHLERWLDYVASRHVEHLVLHYNPKYRCRADISLTSALFRAKSLEELHLCGFNFFESVVYRNIDYFFLKKLKLAGVTIDEQTLQSLLSNSCSSLEEVSIKLCDGFRWVSLCSSKLKSVDLLLNDVEKITIEAPNLRVLKVDGVCANRALSCSIEASKYNQNLKELVLSNVDDITGVVVRVIRGFRVLEKFNLLTCTLTESIRISNWEYPNSDAGAAGLKYTGHVAYCQNCRRRDGGSSFDRVKDGIYKLGVKLK